MRDQRGQRLKRLLIGAAMPVCLAMSPAARGAGETSTWFGGTGNWSDATDWVNLPVLVAFPNDGNQGKTFDAIINSGTVTLDQAIAIQNLTFSGGTITGSESLTMSGTTTWNGGTMSGAGVTHINAGGSLLFTGVTGSPVINGRTVELAGTTTDDAGLILLQNGGALNVLSGGSAVLRGGSITYSGGNAPGTLNVMAGGTLTRSGTSYAQTSVSTIFNNAGTINVTQGTLAAFALFNNTGAVSVQGGKLQLAGGGSATGSFTISDGATLTLTGDYSFLPGASIVSSPASALAVTGGTTTLGTDIAVSNLTFDGGTITGAGKLMLSGATTWNGGTMSGAGVTHVNAGSSLNLAGALASPVINGRQVEVSGIATANAGLILLQNGGTLNVLSGGSLALRGSQISYSGGNVPGTLNVMAGGTLTRSGTTYAQTNIYVPFNNAGEIRVDDGALIAQGSFNNTGAVQVQSGQLLLAGGGSSTNSFSISDGAMLTLSGDYALLPGASIISGPASALAVTGGTLSLGTDIAASNLTFSGGSITGAGSLTLSGTTTWKAGTMSGAGVTHINVGSSLDITGALGSPVSNGRTVEIAGAGTADAGSILLQNGGKLNVLAGGSLALRGSQISYSGGNVPGTLSVLAGGTLTRSGTTYAQTAIAVPFNNDGTVNVTQGILGTYAAFNNSGQVQVQGGQLLLNGGGSATGSFTIADGATLIFASDYSLLPGSSIVSGSASALSVTGGTLTLGTDMAASNLTFSNGVITGAGKLTLSGLTTWNGGTMSGAGVTHINAGTSLNVTGTITNPVINGRTVEIAGTGTADAGSILLQNGGAINVLPGGSLALRGGQISYNGGNVPGALNVMAGATLTRSGTTYAQTAVYIPLNNSGAVNVTQGILGAYAAFNNSGQVQVQGGQLAIGGGGSSTGSFAVADGATLTLSADYSLMPGASIVSGAASSLVINNGTLTLVTDIAASNLTFTFGTITGPGALNLSGTTTWNGGTMSGAGVTHINAGTSLNVTGTITNPVINGRTVEIAGAGTADAGSILLQNGGSLNVLPGGSLALRGGQISYSGGNVPGTLNVMAGATLTRSGTTYAQTAVYIPFNNSGAVNVTQGILGTSAAFNNSGAVSVQGGQLLLNGGGSATGSFSISDGATLTLAADYSLLPGASIVSSPASSLGVTGGTLTLGTDIAASNLTFSAGNITGAGKLTLSGTTTWNGGTMSGASVTHINAGSSLNMVGASGTPVINGRTVEIAGAGTADAGSILLQNGGTLNVVPGGSLALRGSQISYSGGNVPGTLNVMAGATLTRSGTNYAQTGVFTAFNNAGTVTVMQGGLQLNGGGSASGSFNAATGATIAFNSNYTLAGGAVLAGAGTYSFAGATTLTLAGNATISSTLNLAAVNFAGPGDLNLQGNVTYGGGAFSGAGTLTIGSSGSLALNGLADKTFSRRLDNSGTLSWTDGRIVLNDVTLNNLAGGVFSASAANSVVSGTGTNGAVNNAGQFSKTSSSITIFAVPFNNLAEGNVEVAGGTLVLSAGGVNASTIKIDEGATARVSGSFVQAPGSMINSQGNLTFDAAVLTLEGHLAIDGELSFSTATATIKGDATVTKLALVNTSASVAAGGVLKVNSGGILFGGTGTNTVVLQPSDTTPGSFVLNGDVSFTATDGTALLNTANFGTGQLPGSLDLGNAARTFNINDGLAAVDLSVSARVSNGSIVKTGLGTLRLEGANTYTGGTTITAGTLEVTDPAALGTGPVVLGDATLSLRSDVASPAAFTAGLSVTGDGTIRVNNLTAGSIGQFRVGPIAIGTSHLTIAGANRTLAVSDVVLSGNPTIDTAQPFVIDGTISQTTAGLGITKSGGLSKLTLGGTTANTYTGVTRVNAGTLELNKASGVIAVPGDLSVFGGSVMVLADGQIASTSNITVANAGTVLDLGGHSQTTPSLSITGATVRVGTSAGGNGVLRVNGPLTLIGGAKLDLGNNRLIADYQPVDGTPITTIRAALASAYAGGNWNGPGIGSAGIAPTRGLGYAEASEALGPDGGMFGGEGVDGSAVLVRYTLAGDANLDGAVDFNDLVKLAQNYNTSPAGASTWYRGDFNYDGSVDFNDLVKLAQNYNTALAGDVAAGVAGGPVGFEGEVARAFASVPEPGVWGIVGVGLVWGMGRRRRLATAGKPTR